MEEGADVGARSEHPGNAPDVARGEFTPAAGALRPGKGGGRARAAERHQAGTRRGLAAAAARSAEEQSSLGSLAARGGRGAAEGGSGDAGRVRSPDGAAVWAVDERGVRGAEQGGRVAGARS